MTRLDESEIAAAFVCELYCLYIEDKIGPDESVPFGGILTKCRAVLDGYAVIGKNLSTLALNEAIDDKFVDVFHDDPFDEDEPKIRITPKGLRFVKEARASGLASIVSYLGYRENFVLRAVAQDSAVDTSIPQETSLAAADEWAPLPVDRTSTAYEDALRKLEKVRDEFRGDNGFASSEPEKKSAILDALDRGVELLKTNVLTRVTLDALLLRPLKFIVKTFGSAAVAETAKLAVAAVKNLFGL